MENKLTVGQTFEVVEVLTDGTYSDKSLTKINGFTIGLKVHKDYGINILLNGTNEHQYPDTIYMSYVNKEIKPIGRLIVTKVK